MAAPIFHSYFFPDDLSSLQPVSGDLTLLQKPFCFTGYLAVGPQPVLYALYCSDTRLEALKSHVKVIAHVLPINPHNSLWEPCMEVPIFAKNLYSPDDPPMNVDLNALWSRPSNDGTLLHVYTWPLSGNEHNTVIVEALFPFGHQPRPEAYLEFDSNALAEMSNMLESYHGGSVVPDSSRGSSIVPDSSVASSVVPDSSRLSPITCSHDDTQPKDTNIQADTNSLGDIQRKYPQWKTVLVRLRILMRVAISCGEYGNPFLLAPTTGASQKALFIADLFNRSLAEVGETRTTMCPVRSADDAFEVTEEAILAMDNGLAWFIRKEIAKSLVFHLVFRRSVSAYILIVMADFAPDIFRNVPHPPAETLAFVGASCYSAIIQWLADILKMMSDQGEFPAIDLSVYPPVSDIYDELLQAVALLLAQKDDPEHPAFVNRLASFCNILNCETATVAQPPLTKAVDRLADRYPIAAAKPSCISSLCPPPLTTPSTKHILEIEHTENALKSWLQKRGREILPDSLFVTVSVLFAWVDPLDLIAVLQVSLRVVAMEELFQQEELTCVSFLLQGGRCYMEERMYRAQMEVTLFNKAIANLCEEFNTKCRPSPAPLPKYTSTISACQTPRSDEFEGFRLPTAAHLKCQQWLSTSSEFLVDFPQIQEIPQLYENVLRPNDRFLSLPFLMKSWVDNVTYRAYISTSSADCADTKLLGIGIGDSLKAKNEKTPDVLKSDFHILELKKHRAQAEVEMFSEAISRTTGPRLTENGMCSSHGSDGTYESCLPDNSFDDWFDGWFDGFSTSSGSSNASALY
ncbi:uncharacterized protein F5891DRAFT_1197617 [Suillus fuscotomentosus]|uniref:Uncharacterized protein n=1 Tax=Suillus fuscotomentosus TaxID=1912939 RepID=A0AAD4DRJ1_9AGAM|nr:uncharacterized protein F5891DRAFT_1197617 [Suillus fuscotomentosus]KAG1891637.1 hypothetical protein F5891DRAFT_1197617 [Suillus fuscotomentosus]